MVAAGGVLYGLLWVAVCWVALPVSVVLAQVLLAWRSRRRLDWQPPCSVADDADLAQAAPSFVVLVPAHNEAAMIANTVRGLKAQLRDTDQLWVVADNCSDETAALALQAGANVLERTDATRRGKGYALDFGVRHLADQAHGVLIIVDADCEVARYGLLRLARLAHVQGVPVQALYLMDAPEAATTPHRVAAFAWRLKNWVRPLGWHRAGWPCQLMGTGMAFPWGMAQRMALANGDLVEDMKLGLELAMEGTPPLFCPGALVRSEFPTGAQATAGQRKRWEHGHLGMIISHAPGMLSQAMRRRDVRLLAMTLDMAVPPLALLVLLQCLVIGVCGWYAALGVGWAPLLFAMCSLAAFGTAVGLAWLGWGRDAISGRDLLSLPWYVLSKLSLYVGFLFKRQKAWVRTERK